MVPECSQWKFGEILFIKYVCLPFSFCNFLLFSNNQYISNLFLDNLFQLQAQFCSSTNNYVIVGDFVTFSQFMSLDMSWNIVLRTRSTFRRSLCFWKVFLECGISLVSSVLFFTCIHARMDALTGARTHGRMHASFIALITREDKNTVFISLYLGTLLSVPFSRGVGGFRSNGIYRSNPE